jgi:hypothetical protein
MKKLSGIACLEVALIACFLSAAYGQPVTSMFGTDAQKDGNTGKVKERVEKVTQFLESGKSVDGMTETIRYDELGRRLYYFQTRLDVEKWVPTELRYSYTGNTGRVDMHDGSYDLFSFDENGRVKEASSFTAAGKSRWGKKFTYYPSGKPKTIEGVGDDNKPSEAVMCAENADGTLTVTNGAMRYSYGKSGVLLKEECVKDGKALWNVSYDEYGNLVLNQNGYCHESSAADAKDIPTIVRASESTSIRKDSQGRLTERECVDYEGGDVVWYDASMRVVAERSFRGYEITSTRNTYAADGKIGKRETEVVKSLPNSDSPALSCETYVYDEKGRVKTVTETDGSGGYTEKYIYRSDGKLAKVVRGSCTETYSYDESGLLIAKSTVCADTDNRADSPDFTVVNGIETYAYNNDGKMKSQKDGMIFATHCEGDGTPDFADMSESSKEFEYDGQGRLSVERRNGADGSATTVYYRYDPAGKLSNEISVTVASGGGRIYEEKEYAYETENGLLKRTERRNVTRARYAYAYDEKGNVLSCAESNAVYDGKAYVETPKSLTTYTYVYY